MKDDKKVSHILQLYLQWPVFLTALVILAGAAVNLISRKAGFVMLAFTVIYAACAGTLYMYGKKRALGSLVSFASAYSWSQKQLLASLELPTRSRTRRVRSHGLPSHFPSSRGIPL